jgi:5'-3' exonuclease
VDDARVVQMDRRSGEMRDAARVRAKFGVDPRFIPDYLALVGDAADGYPGIPGVGPKTAARLINQYGHLEQFPLDVLRENRGQALLFKTLATLRCDAPLFEDVDELRWTGPSDSFARFVEKADMGRLAGRVRRLAEKVAHDVR